MCVCVWRGAGAGVLEVSRNMAQTLEYPGITTIFIAKTRPFKYIEYFTTKNENFQMFPDFCSKHRWWVLVSTVPARRF